MKQLKIALDDLSRRVTPKNCVLCDQPVCAGPICRQCLQMLPWNDVYCEWCGQAMLARQPTGIFCAACQQSPPPFHKARAPLIYDFPVDAVIKAIKFRRQLWYVPALSDLLLQYIEREFAAADALLPVPLHRWRQMFRGFNQALELCRPLRRATGLPIILQANRLRATMAQTGLNASERRKNLRDAFSFEGKLQCRQPLIIDDVITTGATCSQLALTLLEAGAESVNVLTVARAYTTGGVKV